MTCLRLVGHRELFAFPYPVAIWREAPRSLRAVEALAEDCGIERMYTVGDVVTANFLAYGLRPAAAAVDGRTRREVAVGGRPAFPKVVRVRNPPGHITEEAWGAVEYAVRNDGTLVEVEGEEDMLSLAFIALAPARSLVAYGHHMGALVAIPVDWYRDRLARLLQLMERC